MLPLAPHHICAYLKSFFFQKLCKNNISVKRYCILKIGYLNKTLTFFNEYSFFKLY